MQTTDNMKVMDEICTHCIIENCSKKATPGYFPNCPADPTEQDYIDAFRLRNNGKPRQNQ
jgi:hypothetical protein